MGISGGGGKESSKWKSNIKRSEKPEYQKYAQQQVDVMQGPANRLFQQAAWRAMNAPGMSRQQQQDWRQGYAAMKQYGAEGPKAMAAKQYIQPYLGEGYMKALDPYFTAQRQELAAAVPLEQAAYWQDMKRNLGPLWGTSGRGLEETAESYGKLRAAQQQKFADLEASKAAAQQAGIQWTGGMTPTYAEMLDPTAWNQALIQYGGIPEEYLNKQRQMYAQEAAPWSEIAMNLADMAYRYPQYVDTTEKGRGAGKGWGIGGGFSICWIVRALYGNTGKKTDRLIKLVNDIWPRKSIWGNIRYRLYMRFGSRIATFIKKDCVIARSMATILRWYFDRQYRKLTKGV